MKMTHTEYANALRRIADFVEVHTDLPVPYLSNMSLYEWTNGKELCANAAKAFGTCKKESSDNYFSVKKDFGGITLTATTFRKNVCERVVVGTEQVPETVVPATPSQVIPAHTREIVEWKCPESLL